MVMMRLRALFQMPEAPTLMTWLMLRPKPNRMIAPFRNSLRYLETLTVAGVQSARAINNPRTRAMPDAKLLMPGMNGRTKAIPAPK